MTRKKKLFIILAIVVAISYIYDNRPAERARRANFSEAQQRLEDSLAERQRTARARKLVAEDAEIDQIREDLEEVKQRIDESLAGN